QGSPDGQGLRERARLRDPVAELPPGARERPWIHPELAPAAAPPTSGPPSHVPSGPLDGPRGPHPDGPGGAQERGAPAGRARTGEAGVSLVPPEVVGAIEGSGRALLFPHVYPAAHSPGAHLWLGL